MRLDKIKSTKLREAIKLANESVISNFSVHFEKISVRFKPNLKSHLSTG